MGVQVRLVVHAPDEATAMRACTAAFKRIAQLEQILSDWRPDSELMRLCRKASGSWVRVSPELFFVLSRAQQLSQRSGGAFDVSVGPYVALWRRARKTKVFPAPHELRSARSRVGWQKIQLDAKTLSVRLTVPGMRLDLGGIAKGYAGDEALRVLKQHGVTRALFEAGGDIVTGDAPPDRAGWVVQVPANGKESAARSSAANNSAAKVHAGVEEGARVSWRRTRRVRLKMPRARAKGYAGDEALAVLKTRCARYSTTFNSMPKRAACA